MAYQLEFITDIKTIITRDLEALKTEIEETDESILWHTIPGLINPVATLAHHICGNLRHFIGGTLGEDGYIRDRNDEFANRNITKPELLLEIEHTSEAVEAALSQLAPEELTSEMKDPPALHQGKSVGFFLIQLCCHLSRHRGQLNYLKRIHV